MSNEGQGGGRPPPDDRTLLDPLSSDELRALREARQRMQAKKSAVAHQIVIGPDTGEDIGDAPTRAMPALPSFDSKVSLDQIDTNAKQPLPDPAERGADQARTPRPSPPQPDPSQKVGGFGENTLLWMEPPKLPEGGSPAISTTDVLREVSESAKREGGKGRLLRIGLGIVFVLAIVGTFIVLLSPKERGVIELRTTPPNATVIIDGTASSEKTPVKLTLSTGNHKILLQLENHEDYEFVAAVEKGEEKAQKRDIDLEPISKPGMMTVTISVQPIGANITLDGKSVANKRTIKRANVDPKIAHKLEILAGGYVKIEQEIKPGELQKSYNFVLEKKKDE